LRKIVRDLPQAQKGNSYLSSVLSALHVKENNWQESSIKPKKKSDKPIQLRFFFHPLTPPFFIF